MRVWMEDALPAIYAFVLARCGGVQAVAEDVTQETMVEVVRHREGFDGRSSPTTWACGIARHKVADHYRADYRERRRRLHLLDERPAEAELETDALERREAVVDTLRRLPEAQGSVLAMHYLDGLGVRDIAGRLGRSESAVESLLARARDGFRRAWNEIQGDQP